MAPFFIPPHLLKHKYSSYPSAESEKHSNIWFSRIEEGKLRNTSFSGKMMKADIFWSSPLRPIGLHSTKHFKITINKYYTQSIVYKVNSCIILTFLRENKHVWNQFVSSGHSTKVYQYDSRIVLHQSCINNRLASIVRNISIEILWVFSL